MAYEPVLDPPLKPEPKVRYWDYEKVQQAVAEGAKIPRRWINPDVNRFPWAMHQGDRGTCVGFSTAYGLVFLYWRITKDYPTEDQMKQCKKDVMEDFGSCVMRRYVWFPQMKSAGFAYLASREYGNVTYPSGSYVSASVGSLKVNGCCWENEFWTSMNSTCVPWWHPTKDEKKVRESAKKHCIDGYMAVTSFEGICDAIYNYGFVLMPIDIFSNYKRIQWNGDIGMFPDPDGIIAGSHALCWIGYDLDRRELYCIHSWGDEFPKIGGITERYWRQAAGNAFVLLDEHEDKVEIEVAEKLYSKVTFSSNVPCKWYMNDELRPEGYVKAFSAMLERNVSYRVRAVPEKPFATKELFIERLVTPVAPEHTEEFTFTELTINEKFLRAIAELLKKIINWKK